MERQLKAIKWQLNNFFINFFILQDNIQFLRYI